GPSNVALNRSLADTRDVGLTSLLLYSHRFAKRSRSLRLGLETGNHRNEDDANREAENTFFDPAERIELVSQQITRDRKGFDWEASASYTQPVGKRGLMEREYDVGNMNNDC